MKVRTQGLVASFICFAMVASLMFVPRILSPRVNQTLTTDESYNRNIDYGPATFAVNSSGTLSGNAGSEIIGQFVINSLEPGSTLPMRLYYSDGSPDNNGTATLPQGLSIYIVSPEVTFQLKEGLNANSTSNNYDVGQFSKNDPLLYINGTSAFTIRINVPSAVMTGEYTLWIIVVNYGDSTQQWVSYSHAFALNLNIN